jgi:Putative zinc-finger
MNCTEATVLMSQEQDRTLDGGERLNLRWHTVICSGCRNYRKQMAVLREASRRMAHGMVPGADLPPPEDSQT